VSNGHSLHSTVRSSTSTGYSRLAFLHKGKGDVVWISNWPKLILPKTVPPLVDPFSLSLSRSLALSRALSLSLRTPCTRYYLTPSNQTATICALLRCAAFNATPIGSKGSKPYPSTPDTPTIPMCTTGGNLSFQSFFTKLALNATIKGAGGGIRWFALFSVDDGQLESTSAVEVQGAAMHVVEPMKRPLYSAALYGLAG
jgi:hypothetical protein